MLSRRLAQAATRSPAGSAANVAVAQDPAGNPKPAKDKSTEGSTASSPSHRHRRALVAQEEPMAQFLDSNIEQVTRTYHALSCRESQSGVCERQTRP